jgi:hypothetical protein
MYSELEVTTMPLDKHYKGKGRKVAKSMMKTYGRDWKKVFYATENKRAKKRARKR